MVQWDAAFFGGARQWVKINPRACWNAGTVLRQQRANDVLYSPLHACDQVGTGCRPCNGTVLPNRHEREGRWRWKRPEDKELGLHAGKLKQTPGP